MTGWEVISDRVIQAALMKEMRDREGGRRNIL